jgi:hypothetical protein
VATAPDHAVAVGRDVNITASGGGVAAGVGHRDFRQSGINVLLLQPRRRYLKGQCPESIPVGEPFSLLASIVLARDGAGLKTFDVPPEGRDVLLVVHAPGLRLLGHQRLKVHVPADKDSEPVMFELRADAPGSCRVSVTAWLGGSYLGELLVEITAERDRPHTQQRDVLAEISTEPADGRWVWSCAMTRSRRPTASSSATRTTPTR